VFADCGTKAKKRKVAQRGFSIAKRKKSCIPATSKRKKTSGKKETDSPELGRGGKGPLLENRNSFHSSMGRGERRKQKAKEKKSKGRGKNRYIFRCSHGKENGLTFKKEPTGKRR